MGSQPNSQVPQSCWETYQCPWFWIRHVQKPPMGIIFYFWLWKRERRYQGIYHLQTLHVCWGVNNIAKCCKLWLLAEMADTCYCGLIKKEIIRPFPSQNNSKILYVQYWCFPQDWTENAFNQFFKASDINSKCYIVVVLSALWQSDPPHLFRECISATVVGWLL